MKDSGIYGWRNTENGKWYVGQSVDVFTRKRRHLIRLKAKNHYNQHLQYSWDFYGEEVFEFVILEYCSIEMLDVRERAWIFYYRSNNPLFGYNKDNGGNAFKQYSEESKKKMSNWHKGKTLSKEHKVNISNSLKGNKNTLGYKHTEEARSKISKASKGKTKSDAMRKKLSESKTGTKRKPFSEEWKKKLSEAGKKRYKSLPISENQTIN